MKNSEFFNILATNYDEMINFESSLQNKIKSLKNFIDPNHKLALDLGCGTGVDSIALSQLELTVDAVDHSAEMINFAKQNSHNFDAKINFHISDLTKINFSKKFDFIVSLGNTLANLSVDNLDKVFNNIKNHLSENGKAIIQTINYEALPSSGEYILNKFENRNVAIIRKYLFNKTNIEFIIETTDKENNSSNKIKTNIFPHTAATFIDLCKINGFNFSIFGNLNKIKFQKEKSKNIVLELKL